jgi:hypothetical protein
MKKRFITGAKISQAQSICLRCGKPFYPRWLDGLNKWNSCCRQCGMRNLLDGLDMPTPPIMLDAKTKHPTLTDAEFDQKLGEPNAE